MFYIILGKDGKVSELRTELSNEERHILHTENRLESRHDWKTFDRATEVAEQASKATGRNIVPVDNGEWVWPRYDITEVPNVGDDVSYGFNGDYYPCGKIIKISGQNYRRIETYDEQNGRRKFFWRRRLTGSWVMSGGTWSLVKGIHNDKNPDF